MPDHSPVRILGLTTMGDAAATLLVDGEIVAAVEEERFSRRKHHSGFPFRSVEFCLAEGRITMADVDHVSLYWKPWIIGRKAMEAAKMLVVSRAMFQARASRGVTQVTGSYAGMLRLPHLIRRRYGPSDFRFRYLEHHLCHAASAFLVSPYERAAILTMDGTGEATTTMTAVGAGTDIRPLTRTKIPHSLGQFYSAVTNFLGFDMFAGDEWKVMGLAAYGEPTYRAFFERVLVPVGGDSFKVDIKLLDHHLAKRYVFSEEVKQALGAPREPGSEITQRDKDIAASAQLVLEEVVLGLLRTLHERTGEENLCLAGGAAFNSVMNGRIIREGPFKRVYIQPVAGDAGCSLGAALQTYHGILGHDRGAQMDHVYLGPSYSSDACGAALQEAGLRSQKLADEELFGRVAQLIADGGIVGWFQGRAEFGPRALGNRSFVADPRRDDMRELLNEKVKLREWFRPLAPSMLEDASAQFFGQDHRDPFMVTVHPVVAEQQAKIPAVVHIDGTARPQTVSAQTNPRYHGLISAFEKLTGVPMLLNTSFNIQEPIVCSPADAIRTFRSASFDALVLEDHLVLRGPDAA